MTTVKLSDYTVLEIRDDGSIIIDYISSVAVVVLTRSEAEALRKALNAKLRSKWIDRLPESGRLPHEGP